MTLHITIAMNSDAFGTGRTDRIAEVLEILDHYTDAVIDTDEMERDLFDTNGNLVGKAEVRS